MNIDKLRSFLIDIVKPSIAELIMYKSPDNGEHFNQWQRNCCKQTAIMTATLLNRIFGDEYEFSAYEGFFRDIYQGQPSQYNHAYVIGDHAHQTSKSIFVDIARNHKPCLVYYGDSYMKAIREIPAYSQMRQVEFEELDLDAALLVREYFTQDTGQVFFDKLVKYIDLQNILEIQNQ
jgi:hypothetical protein